MYSRSNALKKAKPYFLCVGIAVANSVVKGSSVAKKNKQDMRLTAGCFDKLNMTIWRILNFTTSHQADNLAELRQEFLSVTEPIAKILGAVSRTRKHPSETKPNVHVVRDFGLGGC